MKKSFQLILGIGILLLFIASVSLAQGPYFVSISGAGFVGRTETTDYNIHPQGRYLETAILNSTFFSHVNFPHYLKYIERMSITFYDNNGADQVSVTLYKQNRWTGVPTAIATCNSGILGPSVAVKSTSVILGPGRGIDNANYIYYVYASFGSFPGNMRLYSVTFKCQPE